MSSANIDAMVREAKRAIRAGNKAEAQKLLLKATELDQSNEQAWMWLSAVVDTIEDQIICLENVLQINPGNADAKRGLDMLRKKAPPPVEKPPAKSSNPFLIEDVHWEIDANTDFLLDALSPSSNKTTTSSSSPRDLLDDDPINPPTDPFISVFETTDVFQTTYDDDSQPFDRLNMMDTSSSITTKKDDFDDISSLDDAIFGDDAQDDLASLDAVSVSTTTPVPKTPPPAAKKKAPAPKPQPESDMGISDDEDPATYFQMIPADIKPTRIPGINETYPPMLIPSIIVLVVLNIGAFVMLFLN